MQKRLAALLDIVDGSPNSPLVSRPCPACQLANILTQLATHFQSSPSSRMTLTTALDVADGLPLLDIFTNLQTSSPAHRHLRLLANVFASSWTDTACRPAGRCGWLVSCEHLHQLMDRRRGCHSPPCWTSQTPLAAPLDVAALGSERVMLDFSNT